MWMSFFKYGVPVLGILGFGHAAYEVFSGKVDPEEMGMTHEHHKAFGVCVVIQTLLWCLILIGQFLGASWPHSVVIFTAGMWTFDYIVSLPLYEKLGDKTFKYWAGVLVLVVYAYMIWA